MGNEEVKHAIEALLFASEKPLSPEEIQGAFSAEGESPSGKRGTLALAGIVAAFAASPLLGIASTVSILVHEVLQEISEFFVLRGAGLPVRTALMYNFLVSSTILIGSIGGYFLLEQFAAIEVPLLGLAAGSYLIVVFHDLIPHSFNSARERGHYGKHVMFFLTGIALMAIFVTFLPHA